MNTQFDIDVVIERAGAIYDGSYSGPVALIAKAAAVGLAAFKEDLALTDNVEYPELLELYFIFACFVLLALGEEL